MTDDLTSAINQRMAARIAATAARRAQRQQQRSELGTARAAGLRQRHAAKTRKTTDMELRRSPKRQTCPTCAMPIGRGETIARGDTTEPWVHAACLNPDRNS